MAIVILGKTACSICGNLLVDGDDIVSTMHFVHDQAHPFWRFSDSGMHQRCFIDWPQREAFRQLHNQAIGTMIWGEGHSWHMDERGNILRVEGVRG
ncbi:hypothetical protein C7S18_06215 [Ahniella affigens]|uniref:Uncharacterized protein n=1 Tax=Ahniella affigens TaxID=2021234 RepID=A0A2P1PPP6_9GAMM|nr:hypothetical protein [Ahniella affigens]AVP96820.1 hypothetical protein C7S18_06215 [Ahniella affigens]